MHVALNLGDVILYQSLSLALASSCPYRYGGGSDDGLMDGGRLVVKGSLKLGRRCNEVACVACVFMLFSFGGG